MSTGEIEGASSSMSQTWEPRWKAVVFPSELVLGHGREQMLARVLLHVVKAAGPVQLKGSWTFRDGGSEKVEQFTCAFLDIHHGHAVHRAEVTGLPPALGVKDRVLQDHEGATILLSALQDAGLQRGGKRIAFVGRKLDHPGSLAQRIVWWSG